MEWTIGWRPRWLGEVETVEAGKHHPSCVGSCGGRSRAVPSKRRDRCLTVAAVPSVLCLWEVRHFEAITGQVEVRGRSARLGVRWLAA